jgi:hypothetical protein
MGALEIILMIGFACHFTRLGGVLLKNAQNDAH